MAQPTAAQAQNEAASEATTLLDSIVAQSKVARSDAEHSRAKDILSSLMLTELFKGLGLTGRHLFKRKVTVMYPEEKTPAGPRFRASLGHVHRPDIHCGTRAGAHEGRNSRP